MEACFVESFLTVDPPFVDLSERGKAPSCEETLFLLLRFWYEYRNGSMVFRGAGAKWQIRF